MRRNPIAILSAGEGATQLPPREKAHFSERGAAAQDAAFRERPSRFQRLLGAARHRREDPLAFANCPLAPGPAGLLQ